MRLGLLFRLYVLWGFVVVTTSVTKSAKRKVAGRRSRQVFEVEPVEGVWSDWGEWSDCSQTCGVGVSQRSRKCLPPPPQHNPHLSHSPPNWAGYLPGGIEGPVISPVHPYYPPRYPGQHQPYHSPSVSANHNPGLSLYRNTNTAGGGGGGGGGGGAPLPGQANPNPSFYQPEFSPTNQEHVSVYRSPYHAPSHGYNQPARTIRRPTNPGAARAAGSRRSVSTNREGLPARRSSAIRPGQFGYGRVPFSLPLHRPNRQVRHTVNGTDNEDDTENNRREEEVTGSDGEDREAGRRLEEESTKTPAAEEFPTMTTTTGYPHRHVDRLPQTNTEHRRARVPPSHPFSRSSSPSLLPNRHRFDWHSVTAPPPPIPPLSRPNSPAIASPFSSPLHRSSTMHRQTDRELHQGFPPAGNIYPLQHPHNPHLGVESGRDGERGAQVYRCSGPEKEYQRCFSQMSD